MEYIGVILLFALIFGVCYLVDKGFTKLFRNQSQHHSGKAVRLNRHYGSGGLILFVFGVAVLLAGLTKNWLLTVCGILLMLIGGALTVYYMTFGIFYDDEGFVLTTFGKKSTLYRYANIQAQQLYVTSGQQVVIELYMDDGRSVQLQSAMTGIYDFMDGAFSKWLAQTGRKQEDCDFYDPKNSCWFPPVEG